MRKPTMFTSLIVAWLLLLAYWTTGCFAPAPAFAQVLNGYEIKQKMEFYGQIDIHSAARGTRIDAREVECFLLPNSTALLFNHTNKLYCEMAHEIWLGRYGPGGMLSKVAKGGTGVCANHKVTQYWADYYKAGHSKKDFRIEFWTTNDLVLPKQVIDAYLQFLGLPAGYGMPLRIVRHYDDNYTSKDHRAELFLATYEAKPAVVTLADLSPPQSGFTRARDEMEVILTDSNDESRRQ